MTAHTYSFELIIFKVYIRKHPNKAFIQAEVEGKENLSLPQGLFSHIIFTMALNSRKFHCGFHVPFYFLSLRWLF